jgi:cytochrome c553
VWIRTRDFKAIGIMLAIMPLLALLVAWLGVFNIAASAGHPALLHWFLDLGKTRSIEWHSRAITPPPDLLDINRVRLGAAHFEGGCAECHGAPGRAINPVYEHMLPMPPDLAMRVPIWETRELHWIVRHGLQLTGMPAWSGDEHEDELWSMVAFLLALPELDADAYQALAGGNLNLSGTAPASARVEELVEEGISTLARTACDRCHDTADAGPPSALVPRLAGQSAAYIERSLQEYRRGERRSGFMQPVAAALDDRQIAALAQYYSTLAPAPPASSSLSDASPPQASQAEAALIATGENQNKRIPACLSCHGADSREDFPRLAGQHAPYLAQQLRLFQAGHRRQSAWGEVMAAVATRLSEEQIEALAHWFSRQPRPQVRGE